MIACALLALASPVPFKTFAHELGVTSVPGLAFVAPSRPYIIEVQGSGWHRNAHVVFSMKFDTRTLGQEIRATSDGSFLFGISGTAGCSTVVFHATAVGGRTASLTTPLKMCTGPFRQQTTALHLHVIQGTLAPGMTVHIEGMGPLEIHVRHGDRVSIREIGTRPAFLPHPDLSHFTLLAQRDGPSPAACFGSACADVRVWVYVATERGTAFIGMEPACRESHPACMLAGRAVRVVIA